MSLHVPPLVKDCRLGFPPQEAERGETVRGSFELETDVDVSCTIHHDRMLVNVEDDVQSLTVHHYVD